MPLHDYKCADCGHVERNLVFRVKDIPRLRVCEACGKKAMKQVFDQFGKGQIHLSHSSMYGKYHPQMGCVIESYGHKQELMRRWGMEEASDPIGGNRKHSEEARHDQDTDQPDPNSDGVIWGDREQVMKQIDKRYGTTDFGVGRK